MSSLRYWDDQEGQWKPILAGGIRGEGVSKIFVSDEEPAEALDGDLWFHKGEVTPEGHEHLGYLPVDGSRPLEGDVDAAGYRVAGLGDATADADALNRQTGDARYLQESDGDARYTLQVGGTIRGYVEPSDDPGASGTVTLDLSTHNVYDVTPTGTIDFEFSGLPPSGDTRSATVIVRNDSHAITWPAGTRFADGEAPELDGETWLVVVAVGSEVTVFESATGVA